MRAMKRTWEVLDAHRHDDPVGHAINVALLTLVSLNVAAVVLETVPSISARWGRELFWFELASVAVFSAEYLLRLWAAPADPRYRPGFAGRVRYAFTPMALVDLVAILPFFLPMAADLRVARALRLMRLFRLAKLPRYARALRLFGEVARARREELLLTSFVVFLLLLVSSSLMYFVENAAQPDKFSSIPATMWWAVATLTTVGYGDVYPITPLGRFFGSGVAIMGIGLFALPTAILGTGFVDAVAREKAAAGACPACGHRLEKP